jgi:transposase, IS30 family
MKKSKKISKAERLEIGILLKKGYSLRAIARAMARSPNSISSEVKRNSTRGVYDPLKAEAKERVRLKYRRFQWRKINQDDHLRSYIIRKLKRGWNPDEISGRMKEDQEPFFASKTAIYEWLYSARGQAYCHLLYSRRYDPKPQHKKTERVMIPQRKSLQLRPLSAANRSRYGHWEGDALISGKRGTGGAAVGVERKSRFARGTIVPSLSPALYAKAQNQMTADCKTLSWSMDNGQENREHQSLAAPAFFCDPYSSWQKGAVENLNKMIRRYLPKGTNFARVSQKRLDAILLIINNKPRKILKYKTALEVASAVGVILLIKRQGVLIEG